MIEARIAVGVKYKSLVSNSSDIITVSAITMFDTTVSHPALKFTAVLENEPAKVKTHQSHNHQRQVFEMKIEYI